MEKWHQYKNAEISGTGSVESQLSSAHQLEVIENKKYVEKLFSIMIFLTSQGLGIRGHDQSDNSVNKGNFLELCQLFSKFDISFSAKLQNTFSLTSNRLQNEIIETISIVFQKIISNEIKSAGFYCLIADDARSHKQEYISICVRYVINLKIIERFLYFENVSESQNSISLYNTIKNKLEALGIYQIPIIGQAYDGAAVMSGSQTGLNIRIQNDHPSALYIHCMAHKLNLVIVNSIK